METDVNTTPRKRRSSQMVRVSDDLYDELRDLARIHGVSIQAAAEYAIEAWLLIARQRYNANVKGSANHV